MQPDVVAGDLVGGQNLLSRQSFGGVRHLAADEGAVDRAVDDDMGDMDALGPQFARQTLGQSPERVLRPGESGKARAAAKAGGRAGEQDRATPALDHRPRGLAAGQESGQRGHLPDFGIDLRRRLDDRETHVGANVEDQNFDRAGVARPSGDAGAEALASEGARDRSAESVAGPDHQADAASRLAHKLKPGPETARTAQTIALNSLLPNPSGPDPDMI